MKVVFLANACDHVIRPLCDSLYQQYGDEFMFIQTGKLVSDRKGIGSEEVRPYIFSAVGREEEARVICAEAQAVIFGGVPLEYIRERIEQNKLTLYYSERLFKKGYWRYAYPKTRKRVKERFIIPSKNSNFHLLCASSFAAWDFCRIGAFENKMYKYGYQIEVLEKDVDALMANKPQDGLSIIWVGRLVKVKNCDHAIKAVRKLVDDGLDVKLTIIGSGPEEAKLKKLASSLSLEDHVEFKGVCKIADTRQAMDQANIFLFTSDFGEGWGATLNECMNSGCACVASDVAGSTYFLVDDEKDALVYRSGDIDMLYKKTAELIRDKARREQIGRNAYAKMVNVWNPAESGKRVAALIDQLSANGDSDLFEQGPCSKAEVITADWYKTKQKGGC